MLALTHRPPIVEFTDFAGANSSIIPINTSMVDLGQEDNCWRFEGKIIAIYLYIESMVLVNWI